MVKSFKIFQKGKEIAFGWSLHNDITKVLNDCWSLIFSEYKDAFACFDYPKFNGIAVSQCGSQSPDGMTFLADLEYVNPEPCIEVAVTHYDKTTKFCMVNGLMV